MNQVSGSPGNRPLSPHLQVYRPQITTMLSILHRMTGFALVVGTLVLTWWLVAAAVGGGAFETASAVIGSWFGLVLLIGWTFALAYHLCNGIRHLFWDAGYGYELDTATRSGWAVVIGSLALTVLIWALAFAWGAGA